MISFAQEYFQNSLFFYKFSILLSDQFNDYYYLPHSQKIFDTTPIGIVKLMKVFDNITKINKPEQICNLTLGISLVRNSYWFSVKTINPRLPRAVVTTPENPFRSY